MVRKLRRVLFLLDTLLPCGNKQLNCMYDFYGEWRYKYLSILLSGLRLQLSKLYAKKVVLPEYWGSSIGRAAVGLRAREIPSELTSARVYRPIPRTPGVAFTARLRAATCSLAGPTPSDIGAVHRRATARAFLEHFDAVHRMFELDENVVLGGDLGWDDDLDGPLRLGDDG